MNANVKIFCDDLDQHAKAQVKLLSEHEAFANGEIRIMPDGHAGHVVPIGFVAKVPSENPIMINAIGNDIGCGILCCKYDKPRKSLSFSKIDSLIRDHIPTGSDIHGKIPKSSYTGIELPDPYEFNAPIAAIMGDNYYRYDGTLGGGNHFIEIDQDDEGYIYVIVHTGSRGIGSAINKYYLDEVASRGKLLKSFQNKNNPYEMYCLYDNIYKLRYIEDTYNASLYAAINRREIVSKIEKALKLKRVSYTESIHNKIVAYSDHGADDSNINKIRTAVAMDEHNLVITYTDLLYVKGAILTYDNYNTEDQYRTQLNLNYTPDDIIPINSAEGCVLVRSKKNEDYLYCAPHGSGRTMIRSEVASKYTVNSYKKMMKDVYSPTINKNTLDEIPAAYRSLEDIKSNLEETVEIYKILHPIYNYKGGK